MLFRSTLPTIPATLNSSTLTSVDELRVAGIVGSVLTTNTTGILSNTIFEDTIIGGGLVVNSTGSVGRATGTTVLNVAGTATDTSNPNVTVNGLVGAVIP